MISFLLFANFVLILTYMTVWFVLAGIREQLTLVDIAWGGGFIVAALVAYGFSRSPTSELLLALVIIWGVRLMLHIGARTLKKGEDRRYQELAAKWKHENFWTRAYGSIFVTQALLIWVVALPITLGAGASGRLVWYQWLAAAIWALAFIFESLADFQLKQFLSNPQHKKIMDRGLWRYSRHPNYFGEIIQWFAIAVIALAAPYGYIGFIGPIVLAISIIFVSGLPPLEKKHLDDPDYKKYRVRTSPLIPLPTKRSRD